MTTDFRALCAELTEKLDELNCLYKVPNQSSLIERARAALADEPAAPEGREPASVTGQPSDEEVLRIYGLAKRDYNYEGPIDDWPKRAERAATVAGLRAVLARWGNRQGLLDSSPPADGEVAELVAEIRHFLAGYQKIRGLDPEHIYSIHRGDKMEAHITVSRLTRAAELLQRQALPEVGE